MRRGGGMPSRAGTGRGSPHAARLRAAPWTKYVDRQAAVLAEARRRLDEAELANAGTGRVLASVPRPTWLTATPPSFGELGEQVGRVLREAWRAAEEIREAARRDAAALLAEARACAGLDEVDRDSAETAVAGAPKSVKMARVDGSGPPVARAETTSARTFWRVLLVIVVAGIGLRVGYVLTVTQHDHGFYDAVFYEFEARSVVDGRGFVYPLPSSQADQPAADHPPLTVLALVPAAELPGNSRLWMRFTMVAFGAAVVLLVGLLGRGLAGSRVGLTAAAIAAVYANLWMNDGLLMSETLAALTTVAAVLLAYRYLRRPSWGLAGALGVMCGLAALARAELALLVVLLALPAAWIARRGIVPGLQACGAVLAGVVLVVGPWVGFNLARFQQPTFISTGDGFALLGASCGAAYHGPLQGLWDVTCLPAQAPRGDESTVNLDYRNQATSYLQGHLRDVPVVVLARLGRLLGVDNPAQIANYNAGEGRPRWASWLGIVSFLLLLPFAVGGFVWLRRQRMPRARPLLAPVWVVLVSAVVFYGTPRFRAPAEPIVVALAAVGGWALAAERRPALLAHLGADAGTPEPDAPQVVGAASPAGPAI